MKIGNRKRQSTATLFGIAVSLGTSILVCGCSNSDGTKKDTSTQSSASGSQAGESSPGDSGKSASSGQPGESHSESKSSAQDEWVGSGPNGGRYKDGVYFCCEKGEARETCCAGKAQGMCFNYGGQEKDCAGPGGVMNRKSICSLCCPGLTRIETDIPGTKDADDQKAEGCDTNPVYPPGVFFCTACGNGVCDEKENFCNCPADCPRS